MSYEINAHILSPLSDELDSLVKSSSKERDKVNTAKKKLLSLSVRSQELSKYLSHAKVSCVHTD